MIGTEKRNSGVDLFLKNIINQKIKAGGRWWGRIALDLLISKDTLNKNNGEL